MLESCLVFISRSPKSGFTGPPDDPFHRPPIKRNTPVTTDDTTKNKSFHAGLPKGHKGTSVIGGNVGGIRYQIKDGSDGFLVSSIEEAADRIVQLVKDEALRHELGQKAKQKVKNHFLLTRLLEQYLDLFNSFETVYSLKTQ